MKDNELNLKEIQDSEWFIFLKEDDINRFAFKEKRETAMGILFLCALVSFFAIIILHLLKVTEIATEPSILFAILMTICLLTFIILYLLFYANEQKYNFRQYRRIYKKTMPKEFQKKHVFNNKLLKNEILPLLHSYRNCKKYIEDYPIYIAELNKKHCMNGKINIVILVMP